MNNIAILVCESGEQTEYEFKKFRESFAVAIKSANVAKRKVTLKSGHKISFKSSDHGRVAYVGMDVDVFKIQDFKRVLRKRLLETLVKNILEDPEDET